YLITGVEQLTEMDTETGGHSLCLRSCTLQRFGCRLGRCGVRVLEAPVDVSRTIGAGLDGDIEDACRGVGGGAHGPGLVGEERVAGTPGGGKLIQLVVVHRADDLLI